MLATTLLIAAQVVPVRLDALALEDARKLDGKYVAVSLTVGKPIILVRPAPQPTPAP